MICVLLCVKLLIGLHFKCKVSCFKWFICWNSQSTNIYWKDSQNIHLFCFIDELVIYYRPPAKCMPTLTCCNPIRMTTFFETTTVSVNHLPDGFIRMLITESQNPCNIMKSIISCIFHSLSWPAPTLNAVALNAFYFFLSIVAKIHIAKIQMWIYTHAVIPTHIYALFTFRFRCWVLFLNPLGHFIVCVCMLCFVSHL